MSPRKCSGRFLPRTLWPPHQGHLLRDSRSRPQVSETGDLKQEVSRATRVPPARAALPLLAEPLAFRRSGPATGRMLVLSPPPSSSLVLEMPKNYSISVVPRQATRTAPTHPRVATLRTPPRSASRARARTEVFLSNGTLFNRRSHRDLAHSFSNRSLSYSRILRFELPATYMLNCLNQRRDMHWFRQKEICSSFLGICFSGCRGKHYDRHIGTMRNLAAHFY